MPIKHVSVKLLQSRHIFYTENILIKQRDIFRKDNVVSLVEVDIPTNF